MERPQFKKKEDQIVVALVVPKRQNKMLKGAGRSLGRTGHVTEMGIFHDLEVYGATYPAVVPHVCPLQGSTRLA